MRPLEIVATAIAGVGGVCIAFFATRRRVRRAVRKELDDLSDEVHSLRALLLEQRRYIFIVVNKMIDHGIDVPPPPAPSFDRDEYKDEF